MTNYKIAYSSTKAAVNIRTLPRFPQAPVSVLVAEGLGGGGVLSNDVTISLQFGDLTLVGSPTLSSYKIPAVDGEGGHWNLNATAFAAASHTHPASDISDSTIAGRAMITAADAPAQRTLLSLAAIATSASANDLVSGTLPGARFDDTSHGDRSGGTLHDEATISIAGFMSSSDKTKLDGVDTGAEVNQSAFSAIAVSGQSDVVADQEADTLTLVAGTNITITTNAGADSVTIAAEGGGSSALRGHIYGLIPANGTDADHDINWSAGECSSTDTSPIPITLSALVKQADAVFAAGTNAGAMVSGESLPTSGTIHWWAIKKADGTVDICCNNHATSGLSPTLPTDFLYKRRIASMRTNASANIIALSAMEAEGGSLHVDWIDPPLSFNSTVSTSPLPISLQVPAGLELFASIQAAARSTGGTNNVIDIRSPARLDEDPASSGTAPLATLEASTNAGGYNHALITRIRTNTSGQIRAEADANTNNLDVVTLGFVDPRR